ncbi:UPF0764 protein C16orf89 homolog [Thrips palmi]|uniref:UPF0764 protein C16orf89 homolog n=1 Tax=Thrips palmi TaxID=161013 RepID=A0A6P8YS92_THRPL|nr:UPF0764 protein C16orf89 homolog [Thrips palmi]
MALLVTAGGALFVVLAAAASQQLALRDGPEMRLEALDLQARLVRGDVYRTLDAVERLAQFLDLHEDIMTKDLALGAAISESAVQMALLALRSAGPGLPAELDALAARLGDLAAVLRKATRAKVDDDDDGESEAYTLNLALRGSPTEAESAHCIGLLLQRPCRLSEQCVRTETRAAASGYTATHRLLFHHVASKVGCGDTAVGVGSEEAIAHLCRRILLEATAIANAQFPPLLRDLFAEQVALCGLRNFAEFARRSWLDEVLSWQRPAGCFGNYTELQGAAQPFHVLADNARLDDRLGSECVSHLTGVAAAAVAFNMRVLVDELLQDLQDEQEGSSGAAAID